MLRALCWRGLEVGIALGLRVCFQRPRIDLLGAETMTRSEERRRHGRRPPQNTFIVLRPVLWKRYKLKAKGP
jgi:hypothetical protein